MSRLHKTNIPALQDKLGGQKGLGPLEKHREMPHDMFRPRKTNNIPDFKNQRYINS